MTDWTTEAADTVEKIVAGVRDRTLVPAQRVVKAVVAGLVILFLVAAASFMLLIGLFRLIDVYLPGEAWSAYLLFGGIFLCSGMLCWRLRHT